MAFNDRLAFNISGDLSDPGDLHCPHCRTTHPPEADDARSIEHSRWVASGGAFVVDSAALQLGWQLGFAARFPVPAEWPRLSATGYFQGHAKSWFTHVHGTVPTARTVSAAAKTTSVGKTGVTSNQT